MANSSARAADWPSWRGPLHNGYAPAKNLPDKFDVGQPGKDNLVWEAPYGCRATPLIFNGRVYLNGPVGEKKTSQERVVCLDEKTGRKIWEHRFNVWLTAIVQARVTWTNLAGDPETGNVYCHGVQGLLTCFDKDGKILWQRSLMEEYGRISGYGGRLTSPVVDEDLVILGINNASWGEYARGGNRFVAFDKKTGDVVWWSSTGHRVLASYQSSPVIATIKGKRLLISGGGDGGIHAFKVRTGEKVWSYLFAEGAINPDPVVDGSRVYVAHGEVNPAGGRQGSVACLDAAEVKNGEPKVVWKVDGPKIKFGSPLLHNGRLYFNDEDAFLFCFTTQGKRKWRFKFGQGGSAGNNRSSPVMADGKIYISDAGGHLCILEPRDGGCKLLHAQDLTTQAGDAAELDGAPAIANGRVFFCTNDATYCIGKPNGNHTAVRVSEKPAAEEKTGEPAHLQVVPAEVTLAPGESATFKARLFDKNGRFLREVKPRWSLGPMLPPEKTEGLPPPPKINPPDLKGELTNGGKLTVPKDVPGQFGTVLARAEGLTGRARVRQVPKLPYKQDFDKVPVGRTPAGWVNTQGKFAVRKENGSNVLVKLATSTNPLFARAEAFFGMPDAKDYTIEADVLGKKVGTVMPNAGVIANRYTLTLYGTSQQLRLISWEALPRIDSSIAYQWKPDTWYRLKLTVSVNGDKATVRGKVWPRGEKEPEKWTVEAQDPVPNREGAPGLFAHVGPPGGQGAEIFYDNVVVTPNKK
ncbi:MAG: PQQ-binding-like beta-propeller repeat protein [Planctomycetes bacterium]|nr:PQQ-binding-like beta-propeller repeat protein [Planctomycetota bacterium]